MYRKISCNIFSSILEKMFLLLGNFFASIILIRLLSRNDFGILGISAGYYSFVNILNVSLEAIILRDHGTYEGKLDNFMYNFTVFNLIKGCIFVIIGLVLGSILSELYENVDFIFAAIATTIVIIFDSLIAPFAIYASSNYKQQIVAKLMIVRQFCSVFLLLGLIFFPYIKYLAIKEFILAAIMISLWLHVSKKYFNISLSRVNLARGIDFRFIKKALFSYSIYTHICGVVTNFVYKSDTFFLSFFTNFRVVGDYNISLTSANMANNISAILGYQNSVALSSVEEEERINIITSVFIRLSIYFGLITLILYAILGQAYLELVTGQQNVGAIYGYMMCIVFSLVLIKTVSGPLTAYINIKGSVKKLFLRVLAPLFVISNMTYLLAAFLWGAWGIACANIVNALMWIMLLIIEIRSYRYKFKEILNIKMDILFIREFFSGRLNRK